MSNFFARQAVKRGRRDRGIEEALKRAAILGARSVLEDVVEVRTWWFRAVAWALPSSTRSRLAQAGGIRHELRRDHGSISQPD